MTLKEIVEQENNNEKDIILFREGFFYRAYNRSAMRFVENIKKCKILSKYVKYLKQDIYYCGFPRDAVEKLREVVKNKGLDIVVNEKFIKIFNCYGQSEDFNDWKSGHIPGKYRKCPDSLEKYDFLHDKKHMWLAPVVEKQYKLIIWFLPKLAKFPKDQRFLLGDRIEKNLLDILELLIEAVYSREKKEILKKANLKLESLRFVVRITKDMKYITVKRYDYFCGLVIEIGRMIGGWKKSLKAKENVCIS